MINKKYLVILILVVIFIAGCGSRNQPFNTITLEDAIIKLETDESIVLLDVRYQEEFDEIRINGSILIPLPELRAKVADIIPDKETRIFVYCRRGNRSRSASQILANLGYENVYDMGGIQGFMK